MIIRLMLSISLSVSRAGGIVPVALTYFGEFCPLRGRGRKVGSLLVFQLGGAVLASGLAWLLIHDPGMAQRFIFCVLLVYIKNIIIYI